MDILKKVYNLKDLAEDTENRHNGGIRAGASVATVLCGKNPATVKELLRLAAAAA